MLQRGIGLAYLEPANGYEPGAEVEVEIRGRRGRATVVHPPFVDRNPR
jgi:aminomethyltransferase